MSKSEGRPARSRRRPGVTPTRALPAAPPRAKPVRRTQAERSETTRTKLILAAIGLMRTRGYGGLRTAEVSDAAGVSRGAQLHHFPTKHELILATMRFMNERITVESRRRALAAKNAEDPVAGIIVDAKDFFFSDFFFVSLAVAMGDARDDDLRRQSLPLSRESRFAVEKAWLETFVAHSIPRKLAGDVIALTLSIIRGFTVRSFIDNDHARFEDLLGTWRTIVGAYLAPYLEPKSTVRRRTRTA